MRNRLILALLAASVAVPATAQVAEIEGRVVAGAGAEQAAQPMEIAQRGEGRRGGGRSWSGQGRRGGGDAVRAPRSTNEAVFRARERAVPADRSARPARRDTDAGREFRQERRGDRQDFRQERRGDREAFRQQRQDWRQDRPTAPADRQQWRREGREDRQEFRRDRQDDRRDFRQDRRDDRRDWNRNNGGRWDRNDNRGWDRNDRRWNDGRGWNDNRGWNGRDRGDWNRGWRNDRRYDWQSYRRSNRAIFRGSRYYAPRGWGYGYQRFGIGISLFSGLYASNYWINDPWQYRLPPAYGSYRWVRYYDDALLVDVRSGYVVDVIHDFFW